jgi:hypothetical protein
LYPLQAYDRLKPLLLSLGGLGGLGGGGGAQALVSALLDRAAPLHAGGSVTAIALARSAQLVSSWTSASEATDGATAASAAAELLSSAVDSTIVLDARARWDVARRVWMATGTSGIIWLP